LPSAEWKFVFGAIEFPTAWDVDFASQCSKYNEVEDEDSNDELDSSSAKPKDPPVRGSLAYQEFLQFLELGCSGSPRDGYPTVVVVLSTIPSHVCLFTLSS
jgi:E3 ubiquitin-protein ligase listerin